jgi:hypothetical protein
MKSEMDLKSLYIKTVEYSQESFQNAVTQTTPAKRGAKVAGDLQEDPEMESILRACEESLKGMEIALERSYKTNQ